MNKIENYLSTQLEPFDRTVLWSPRVWKEGALVMLWWSLPSFLIVWLCSQHREYVPSKYIEAAISEGIGPHLWNVVGALGLLLVGFALLFPRSGFIARSAYQVLINAYAIGGLSLGLLSGQFATAMVSATDDVVSWKKWLIGAGWCFLVIQALVLNFSLWYLAHLMDSRGTSDSFGSFEKRVG